LLEQGRNAEVRKLAEQMLWIFQDKKIHREALASLTIFCEASRRTLSPSIWPARH
jgi:hypothetical protein